MPFNRINNSNSYLELTDCPFRGKECSEANDVFKALTEPHSKSIALEKRESNTSKIQFV